MKNRNYMLMGVAVIATLLTACSNQKFAFRQKVKAGKTEVATTQKTKNNINKPEEAVVAKADVPVPAIAVPNAEASTVSAPAKPEVTKANSDFVTVQNELNKEPVANATAADARKLDKANKLAKKIEHVTRPDASIDARKFIIVGLILILIGVILSLVLGWLGGLVATVGVIIALIGLIVLLMDNV